MLLRPAAVPQAIKKKKKKKKRGFIAFQFPNEKKKYI